MKIYPQTPDLLLDVDIADKGARVYRRFEFPNGIPAECAWINGPDAKHCGIVWVQIFASVFEWRDHALYEATFGPNTFLPRKTPPPSAITEPESEPEREA